MAYRQNQNSNESVGLTACDVIPLIDLHMLNGTTSEITIPCRYVVDGALVPIHLPVEGYGEPYITIDEEAIGFTANAAIDTTDDSVIRIVLTAQCPDAVDRDIYRSITVLVSRLGADGIQRTDSVIRARLLIVAGPIAVQAGA